MTAVRWRGVWTDAPFTIGAPGTHPYIYGLMSPARSNSLPRGGSARSGCSNCGRSSAPKSPTERRMLRSRWHSPWVPRSSRTRPAPMSWESLLQDRLAGIGSRSPKIPTCNHRNWRDLRLSIAKEVEAEVEDAVSEGAFWKKKKKQKITKRNKKSNKYLQLLVF